MRASKRLLLLVCVLILSACAGSFPGAGVLAPKSLDGYEMDASGLKGSYFYNFGEGGNYERVTELPSGKKSAPVSGTWKYVRLSDSTAILTLDNQLVINLAFTTQDFANAKIIDEVRLYPVEFTAPKSE